jgi:hypothetical protein
MGLSNTAAKLTARTVVIAPSHHRRLGIRNVNIDARMPQPDRTAAVGRLRVSTRLRRIELTMERWRWLPADLVVYGTALATEQSAARHRFLFPWRQLRFHVCQRTEARESAGLLMRSRLTSISPATSIKQLLK